MENQKETENISDTTFPVLAGKVRIIFFFLINLTLKPQTERRVLASLSSNLQRKNKEKGF